MGLVKLLKQLPSQQVWFLVIGCEQPHLSHCITIRIPKARREPYQYSTEQYSTVQYSTVQYRTVPYRTVQYSNVLYHTVANSTVQYRTVQYSSVPYSSGVSRNCQMGVLEKVGRSMPRARSAWGRT